MGIISAIIGAASQAATSDINYQAQVETNKINKQIADDYNQMQRDLAQSQMDYDREMWEKNNDYNYWLWQQQNEYNSPAAQMERYQQAGLNPNLIYGQQNTAGSIQSSSPLTARSPNLTKATMQAPQTSFDLLPVLQQFQDFKVKDAQINNIKSQTALNAQKQLSEIERTEINKLEKERGAQQFNYFEKIKSTLQAIEEAKLRNIEFQGDILSRDAADARGGFDSSTPWWAKLLFRAMRGDSVFTYQE